MRKHTLTIAALALAFGSAPAFADGSDDKKGHTASTGHGPKAEGRHDKGRHLGWQKKAWKRGDRIVWADVDRIYYVDDYRVYRLSAPPPGYRWIRPIDDHYLLVNMATGVISQALGY